MNQTFRNTRSEYEEELLQCPYVPTHRVAPGTRFQNHLRKCRAEQLKQTTSPFHAAAKDMQVCKFDVSHHVPSKKMAQHMKECDKRVLLEVDLVQKTEEPEWKKVLGRPVTEAPDWGDDDGEDWDKEEAVPAYNPMRKIKEAKGNILFNPQNEQRYVVLCTLTSTYYKFTMLI